MVITLGKIPDDNREVSGAPDKNGLSTLEAGLPHIPYGIALSPDGG